MAEQISSADIGEMVGNGGAVPIRKPIQERAVSQQQSDPAEQSQQSQANPLAQPEQTDAEKAAAAAQKTGLDIGKVNELLSELGIRVTGEEDIADIGKKYSSLRKTVGELEGFTPEEINMVSWARKNGNDYQKYHELNSVDPEKLDDMGAIKKKFMLENRHLDPELAERQFQKHVDTNLTDEDEGVTNKLRDLYGKEAKNWISTQKGGLKPVQSGQSGTKWSDDVDKAMSEIEGTDHEFKADDNIPFGGKLAVRADQKDKERIRRAMDDPRGFLESYVFTDGKQDAKKLHGLVFKALMYDKAVDEARKQGVSDTRLSMGAKNGAPITTEKRRDGEFKFTPKSANDMIKMNT